MYDLDFIAEYFPELGELSPTQLASARTRIVNWLQAYFPDIDMSPGTVYGDQFVSSAAGFLAAFETGQGRFMSDLDLQNPANNIIYSCRFVAGYLGNWGVYDTATLSSTGLVRLVFSQNADVTLNKSIKFTFGTADIFYLRPTSAVSGDLRIRQTGVIPNPDLNEVALVQTGDNTYAVDVPVIGQMTGTVTRGIAGQSTILPTGLVSIIAAVDFDSGLPPQGLPDLARRTRVIAYAASSGSRSGTRAFVCQQWPETAIVSPILTGDREMQRAPASSAMILQQPQIDLYYRSIRDAQQETQYFNVPYDPVLQRFRGPVGFLHRPGVVELLFWAGDPTLVLNPTLYSQITRSDLPGSTGCGTRYEQFWFDLDPPRDTSGIIKIARQNDADGNPYATFGVTYRADPLLESVSLMMESSENAPAGVSMLVKNGPLIHIKGLWVYYRRTPGVTMLLDGAAAEIASYINASGYPDLFSEASMVDSMRVAGAARVESFVYDAVLEVTPAQRRFAPEYDPSTDNDWSNDLNSVLAPSIAMTELAELTTDRVVAMQNADNIEEAYAVTARTVRFYIDPDTIYFQEY